MCGARAAEGRSGGRSGGAARVHVVDENDVARQRTRSEGTCDVAAAGGERKAPLPLGLPCPDDERAAGQLPALGHGAGQPLGGMVAALALPATVCRDERHRVSLRVRHALDDERGGVVGDPAQPALLPAGDEPAHVLVVRDRRARLRKGETPSGAFAAAPDGPRRRRAAALAQRRLESRQAGTAAPAQSDAGRSTDEAPPRQQEVEQPTAPGRLQG